MVPLVSVEVARVTRPEFPNNSWVADLPLLDRPVQQTDWRLCDVFEHPEASMRVTPLRPVELAVTCCVGLIKRSLGRGPGHVMARWRLHPRGRSDMAAHALEPRATRCTEMAEAGDRDCRG